MFSTSFTLSRRAMAATADILASQIGHSIRMQRETGSDPTSLDQPYNRATQPEKNVQTPLHIYVLSTGIDFSYNMQRAISAPRYYSWHNRQDLARVCEGCGGAYGIDKQQNPTNVETVSPHHRFPGRTYQRLGWTGHRTVTN